MRPGNDDRLTDRMIEPLTGRPTTPVWLAVIAVPVILAAFALIEAAEVVLAPEIAARVPWETRVLHLARGIGASLVFAGLAAWAVGKNWRRALDRIRAAEARARTAEAARHERERLAALGRIAAGVAHEIGNPLASISAICQLIEKKGAAGDDGRLADRARLVRTEVDRIARIVGNLLAFARPADRGGAVRLRPVLDRVAEMVGVDDRSAGVEVDVKVEPPDIAVEAPAGPVEQVVLNLVWNAVEAIHTAGDGAGRVRVSAHPGRDGEVVLEVADDGPGVPEAIGRRIFEPFFSTKEMGTGLGLSVVHGLVEDAGGRIDVGRSDLGGALFRVVLPAHAVSVTGVTDRPRAAGEDGGMTARAVKTIAAVPLAIVLLAPPAAADEAAADFYRAQCLSCHTIGGGPLQGPDLKDVEARKDRAWLANFIVNPELVIASGDPYALELQRAARGVVMPRVAGITPAIAEDLLDLIAEESAKETSVFRGTAIADRPALPTDIQLGHDLFTGERRLAGGGPACMTCHDLARLPWLGGGRLGPNLDEALGRIGGRQALGAWLAAPPSPMMAPIYRGAALTPEEVFALAAYLEETAQRRDPPRRGAGFLGFVFAGIAGAGGLLGLGDLIWRRRFTAVRRPLVEGKEERE